MRDRKCKSQRDVLNDVLNHESRCHFAPVIQPTMSRNGSRPHKFFAARARVVSSASLVKVSLDPVVRRCAPPPAIQSPDITKPPDRPHGPRRHTLDNLRKRKTTIAPTPTMGALHDGHVSLVRLTSDRQYRCVNPELHLRGHSPDRLICPGNKPGGRGMSSGSACSVQCRTP